ncbi:MAG: flavodoxin family protein [Methanosphaera sp.]|nr:flavodoxin family protein [Methanosphaera sp.]
MKNVLVLMGSPRLDGNTNILCDQFIKAAKETGANIEKIFVQEKNIKYCYGCNACFKTGNDNCLKIDDDMPEILDSMQKADVIVFATPVYFYTLSGQLKVLIDRTVPRYQKFSDKEVYIIIVAATKDKTLMERTVEDIRGYLDCLPNPHEKGIIYGNNAWEIGEIKNTPAYDEAYQMGKTV